MTNQTSNCAQNDQSAQTNSQPTFRSLNEIASEIVGEWENIDPVAGQYLDAMADLNSIDDYWGYDSARMIVGYFLSYSTGWTGEEADEIKAELQAMLDSERPVSTEVTRVRRKKVVPGSHTATWWKNGGREIWWKYGGKGTDEITKPWNEISGLEGEAMKVDGYYGEHGGDRVLKSEDVDC
jgi:hypothetical protein